MDKAVLDYLEIGLLVLAAITFIVYFIRVNYRSAKRNNAAIETARAVAYYKHPEIEATTIKTAVGVRNENTHYITFHTDSGDILKLYMNSADYLSIPEGSWGTLTWQSDRFLKFEKEE